jgi:YidC/Oxa1 family membrane protein insertase
VIPIADIFQPLESVAKSMIDFFHNTIGFNWGWSIVALTVVIRAALVPLTYKQIKSMRALQALQPEIKKIQEKFKNDRQRQQQEMMRFYQQNKINPLASCLPLLLQLPVFFALFRLLRGSAFSNEVNASGDNGWYFIKDITAHPHGAEQIILMLLFVGSMALSTYVTMQASPTAASSQQYIFLGAFALIGVFFVPKFPAGLSIYWITTNIWTVGQQYVAARVIPAPDVPTPAEAAAARPPPPPPRKRKKRR